MEKRAAKAARQSNGSMEATADREINPHLTSPFLGEESIGANLPKPDRRCGVTNGC
jgi:hypothetical protein